MTMSSYILAIILCLCVVSFSGSNATTDLQNATETRNQEFPGILYGGTGQPPRKSIESALGLGIISHGMKLIGSFRNGNDFENVSYAPAIPLSSDHFIDQDPSSDIDGTDKLFDVSRALENTSGSSTEMLSGGGNLTHPDMSSVEETSASEVFPSKINITFLSAVIPAATGNVESAVGQEVTESSGILTDKVPIDTATRGSVQLQPINSEIPYKQLFNLTNGIGNSSAILGVASGSDATKNESYDSSPYVRTVNSPPVTVNPGNSVQQDSLNSFLRKVNVYGLGTSSSGPGSTKENLQAEHFDSSIGQSVLARTTTNPGTLNDSDDVIGPSELLSGQPAVAGTVLENHTDFPYIAKVSNLPETSSIQSNIISTPLTNGTSEGDLHSGYERLEQTGENPRSCAPLVSDVLHCPVFIPEKVFHEVDIKFYPLTNGCAQSDLPKIFEISLRQALGEWTCMSVHRLLFTDGSPFGFRFTNASVNSSVCNDDELEMLKARMLAGPEISSNFSSAFLPLFKIESVQVRNFKQCSPFANMSDMGSATLALIIVVTLSVLPCVFLGLFKVLHSVRVRRCSRAKFKNVLCHRHPLILPTDTESIQMSHLKVHEDVLHAEGEGHTNFAFDDKTPVA